MAVVYPYVKNPTWADLEAGGTRVDAADLNIIEDGIYNAHNSPAVCVTHSANQSITSATPTTLAFNTERFDQAGGAASTQHDNVTNNSRLTCRYAGVYLAGANAEWAGNATGQRDLRIVHSVGAAIIGLSRYEPESTPAIGMVTTRPFLMAVNEYIECVVYQDSGGALNVLASASYSPEFWMFRVA